MKPFPEFCEIKLPQLQIKSVYNYSKLDGNV